MSKLKQLWGGLPHGVQAALVVFATAAAESLGQALMDPDKIQFSASAIHHYLGGAIAAGVIALRVFYMKPNLPAKSDA